MNNWSYYLTKLSAKLPQFPRSTSDAMHRTTNQPTDQQHNFVPYKCLFSTPTLTRMLSPLNRDFLHSTVTHCSLLVLMYKLQTRGLPTIAQQLFTGNRSKSNVKAFLHGLRNYSQRAGRPYIALRGFAELVWRKLLAQLRRHSLESWVTGQQSQNKPYRLHKQITNWPKSTHCFIPSADIA